MLKIAAGVIGGVVVLALAAFVVQAQRVPLPGQKFESNGPKHVAPGEPHGSYFSNPPTSGWMYDPMTNPGVYTRPKTPEELVHFLEHGGVWVLYTCPEGCPELAEQLAAVVNKQIDRNRPAAVAPYPPPDSPERRYDRPEKRINVIAWQYLLSLDEFDRKQIDEFIERHACRFLPEGSGPGCFGRAKGSAGKEKDAGEKGFNAIKPGGAPQPAATAVLTITPSAATPTPAVAGPTPPPAATGTPGP